MTAVSQDVCLDAGMRGFIVNTAKQNLWRVVARGYELDDLIQEGFECYYKCYNAYYAGLTKDHQRQMQALVETAFRNRINTIAGKAKGGTEIPVSQLVGEDGSETTVWDRVAPAEVELGTLTSLVANAPAEIKQLIALLAADGFDLLTYKRKKVGRRATRETNNEFFCRLIGADPAKVNLADQVREYFA